MELDIDKMMKRFTVRQSDQLFDIEQKDMYASLKDNRCIKCGCRLVFTRNGKVAFCRSVKHKQQFLITVAKLNHINGK